MPSHPTLLSEAVGGGGRGGAAGREGWGVGAEEEELFVSPSPQSGSPTPDAQPNVSWESRAPVEVTWGPVFAAVPLLFTRGFLSLDILSSRTLLSFQTSFCLRTLSESPGTLLSPCSALSVFHFSSILSLYFHPSQRGE